MRDKPAWSASLPWQAALPSRNSPALPPARRVQHPDDLLPPGDRLGLGLELHPAHAPARDLCRAPHRDEVVAGHRVAAVLEPDQGSGAIAPGSKPRDHGRPVDRAGGARVAIGVPPGPRAEDLRDASKARDLRDLLLEGAVSPALRQPLDLVVDLAPDEQVKLVARLDLGRAAGR